MHDIETMLKSVDNSFKEYPLQKLEDIFLTLQLVYDEIIKVGRDNNYALPHIKKQKLRKEGSLPPNIIMFEDAGAFYGV
jgi:hypothetical protein